MKRSILPTALAAGIVSVSITLGISGCGGQAPLPHTKLGSFVMIEGAANDIVATVSSPSYKPTSRDLGTDSDRIGMALMAFMKETEGTALAADAQDIKSKFEALEKLAATRAPLPDQRTAAQALQAAVEALKAKL